MSLQDIPVFVRSSVVGVRSCGVVGPNLLADRLGVNDAAGSVRLV